MRLRVGIILAVVVVLLTAACGGKDVESSSSSTKPEDGATTANSRPAYCDGATLTASEIGVTPDTITVTVMADNDFAVQPGLFKGSMDGVKAWADYVNDQGGLACRKVEVKEYDSKGSSTDAKNGIVQACGDSLAMVGTTALFLQDVSTLDTCKDKAGQPVGLPDFAELQTEYAHQCSKVSFTPVTFAASCPYGGSGPRAFELSTVPYDYYKQQYGNDLHGVMAIPKDLPSTIASTTPQIRGANAAGVKSDAEFGISGLALQSDYTPIVQAIKNNNSTYAYDNSSYGGTVKLRKEAQAQGATSVKAWHCTLQCYDQRLISEGGSAVEGQYVWIPFLPFEDTSVPAVKSFLKYDKKPDGFGVQAWIAGEAFADSVRAAIKANGNDPNAITRSNVLKAAGTLENFDAGGLIAPMNLGTRTPNFCSIGMQVKNGKFVRAYPPEPGKFGCLDGKPPAKVSIDPVAEYKG